jgi:hypothetical protein
MKNTAGRILKESDVKLDGQFTLDIVQTKASSSKEPAADLVEPQVRIVESQSEFSVIEITCSCGTSMFLRCDYAGVKAAKIPEKKAVPEKATVSN